MNDPEPQPLPPPSPAVIPTTTPPSPAKRVPTDVPAHSPHRIAARLLLVSLPSGVATTISLLTAVIVISKALREHTPDVSELPRVAAGMMGIFTGGSVVLVLTDELARHVRRGLRLPIVLAGLVLLPFLVGAGGVWFEALQRGSDPYAALGELLKELPGAVRETGTFFAMFLLPFGFVVASRSGALPVVGTLGPLREALVWALLAPVTFTLAAFIERDERGGMRPDMWVRTVGIGLALVAAPLGLALGDRLDARALMLWRRWRDVGR